MGARSAEQSVIDFWRPNPNIKEGEENKRRRRKPAQTKRIGKSENIDAWGEERKVVTAWQPGELTFSPGCGKTSQNFEGTCFTGLKRGE